MQLTRGLVCAAVAVVSLGCDRRKGHPHHPCRADLFAIHIALQAYYTHNDRMPPSLGDLCPEYLSDESALTCPGLAPVPGSNPATTYRYVPCRYTDDPDTIVAYVNLRGGPGEHPPLYVLYLGGSILRLDAVSFEKAIRELGVDYDSLPLLEATSQ